MKIAVLDDSDFDVAIIEAVLLKGFEFDRYKNLKDFQATTQKYDLILLDLQLPESFGTHTVERVRKIHKGRIIVITGAADDYLQGKTMAGVMNAGADDIFQKNKLCDKIYCEMILQEILSFEQEC